MTTASQCSNGHDLEPDDLFCGQCGATTESGPVPEAGSCPEGHPNPTGNAYCGTCGLALEHHRAAPLSDGAPLPPPMTPRRRLTLALLAVGALALLAGTVAVLSSSNSEPESAPTTAAAAETTTTISPAAICEFELSEWMPYVTGSGSLMDAAAEFGTQDPAYGLIQQAWATFNANLYREGRDVASEFGYDVIAAGCTELGADYRPGRLPPP